MKPEIHQDEAVGELTDSAFRLFIGLITQADDAGRLKGSPRLIGSQVWPYHPKAVDEVELLLAELAEWGLICRYEAGGHPYICLPSWSEHQRVDNAGKSRIPEPIAGCEEISPRDSATGGGSRLDQGSRKGSRKGRESEVVPTPDAPLSNLLADLIAANDPNGKRPKVSKRWANAERLLIDRDGRKPAEAERLIRWTQNDEFWRGNVLSMPKFREKYGQLYQAAVKDAAQRRPKGSPGMQQAHRFAEKARQAEAEEAAA